MLEGCGSGLRLSRVDPQSACVGYFGINVLTPQGSWDPKDRLKGRIFLERMMRCATNTYIVSNCNEKGGNWGWLLGFRGEVRCLGWKMESLLKVIRAFLHRVILGQEGGSLLYNLHIYS